MKFQALAEICEKLSSTTKRNQMTDAAADFLKVLDDDEVEPAVSMMLGRAFPKWDQRNLDVSWATLSSTIERLTKTDWKEFSAAFRETGDVGSAVQAVFERNKVRRQSTLFENPLTILEVRKVLEAVAESIGQGARERKERLVETLFGRAEPLEAKYLVKIMLGEMRTGFHEGLMEMAVSKAFSVPLKTVQKAAMFTGDIGEVASIGKTQGAEEVAGLSFKVFRPIKPMLASTAENPDEALKEYGGKSAFEYKLDGARIQIHKSRGEVKIFSRRLTDVTESLPEEWLASVQRDLKACIIEGSSIVFKYNQENKFKAVTLRNGEATATIYSADIVGSLTMKGQALFRMKDKDSYDIYAVAGFYNGGPKQASKAFTETIKVKNGPEKVTENSLEEIKDAFASTTAQGPAAIARFIGTEDARTDSYQRIKTFLENLNL